MTIKKRLDLLRAAVEVYKIMSEKTKNKKRKKDYEEIKKFYESLKYFSENYDWSCGALYPFIEIGMENIKYGPEKNF